MSIIHLLNFIEKEVSLYNSYELYDQRLHFYANGPFLDGVKNFYEPYYIFNTMELPNPTLKIYIYVEKDTPQKQKPITSMLTFLQESIGIPCDNGIIMYERPETGIKIFMDRSRNKIYIIGKDLQELNLQLRTFIRDQLFREIEKENGLVVFHGSAVEKDNRGIVFMGARNAGKTSSLLALMDYMKYNVISFDRIKLKISNNQIQMRGLASRCNIHKVTIENNSSIKPIELKMEIPYDIENKALIPGDLLNELLGTETTPHANLSLLVFPNIDNEFEGIEISEIHDVSSIKEMIKENLMEGNPIDKHRQWFFYFYTPPEVVQKNVDKIIEMIIKKVKVISIRASYDNYIQAIRQKEINWF